MQEAWAVDILLHDGIAVIAGDKKPKQQEGMALYGKAAVHEDLSDVQDKSAEMLKVSETETLRKDVVEFGEPFEADKAFFGAYNDGTDPMFVWRDQAGRKRVIRVSDFRTYFFVHRADLSAALKGSKSDPEMLSALKALIQKVRHSRRWDERGRIIAEFKELLLEAKTAGRWVHVQDIFDEFKRCGTYTGQEPDEVNPRDWEKIFVNRVVVLTDHIKERSGKDAYLNFWDDKQIEKYPDDIRMRFFLDSLELAGVPHYEADLTPRQRFMTDRRVNIEERFRELFFDIETDDRVAGFKDLGSRRILSIAWVWRGLDGEEERGFVVLEDDDNESERVMLEKFKAVIARSELLYAWNGFNFDFPIIRERLKRRGLDYNWVFVVWCDLLSVFRRYFQRPAGVGVSFSLNDIGKNVLKMPKMDWREVVKERCKPGCLGARRVAHDVPRTYYDLWKHHPEILREYNEKDTEVLAMLEKENGFAKLDQAFCRIGNCVPGDFHISTKIDMLLLKKGKAAGLHFRTNKHVRDTSTLRTRESEDESSVKVGSTYQGAFVFEPVKGLHEGVAALDFKSLYPSMMVLFNISPETYVADEDAERRGGKWYRRKDGEELLECPTGAKFLRNVDGFVPQIFKETLEKRKVYQNAQVKEVVGSDKFLLYYRLAYSFKRLGLSFYGELGHRVSRYYQTRIAEAVTLSGQYFIKESAKLAEACGMRVLYGDTDSMYIGAEDEDIKEFLKITDPHYRRLCRRFNVDFKRWIVELEYENYFKSIFFVKKKRYAGLMSMYKGKDADYLEVKGLEFMRSDGNQYGRQLQHDVMNIILREPEAVRIEKIQRVLLQRRRAVLGGKLAAVDVQLTQAIEKDVAAYKTKPPHVRVAEVIKAIAPTEYFAGMKVPWVMVNSKAKPPEAVWSVTWEPRHGYDAEWIWDARTYPPTYRVLMVVYPREDWDVFFVGKAPKLPVDDD